MTLKMLKRGLLALLLASFGASGVATAGGRGTDCSPLGTWFGVDPDTLVLTGWMSVFAGQSSNKQAGLYPLGMEGFREGRWILLDYGDIVIHIFHEPVRKFYELERLWTESPRIAVEDSNQQNINLKSAGLKKPKAPRAAPKKRAKTK